MKFSKNQACYILKNNSNGFRVISMIFSHKLDNRECQKLSEADFWFRFQFCQNVTERAIWQFLRFFKGFRTSNGHFLRYGSEIHRKYSLIVPIKWNWSHSKLTIFGKEMGQKLPIIPYMGILFWPELSHFWAHRAEIFYGNSGNHYLSIAN